MRNYGERISYRGGDWTGVASAGNGDLASERGRTFSWHSVGFRAFMRNYGEFYMTHGGSNGSGVYGGLFNIEIDSRMKDNSNGSKGFRAYGECISMDGGSYAVSDGNACGINACASNIRRYESAGDIGFRASSELW